MSSQPDWAALSREAVRLMQDSNNAWTERYGLADGAHYHWSFDEAILVFRAPGLNLKADITVVGGVSEEEGTFLWAWANDAIPAQAKRDLEKVRAFGITHGLGLLVTPEWPGGHADGVEISAVAGRILDAEGVWVAPTGDVTLYFLLSRFRMEEDLPTAANAPI